MSILEYLIYNFLLIFIVYKCTNKIFDNSIIHNKVIEICSYIIYYILSSVIYLVNGVPIVMLLCNIIAIFLIQFNYKTRIKDKLLITMYIYLIIFVLDLFLALILNNLKYSNIISFDGSNNFSLFSIIIELSIFPLLLGSIKNFKSMRFKVNMPKIFWLPLIIVPFMSIILLLLTINIKEFYKISLMLILLILIILNISVFLLYNYIIEALIKREEQNILEQKYLSYINQFEMIKENFDNLNIIKHDFRKHLIYLSQLILDKNYDESIKYINNIIDNNILGEYNKIINTGNTCIDTIINLKLNGALNNNIKITPYVMIPYDLDIFSVDIICLLGNLLDNSIEANLKLEEKDRYIFLKIKYYNENLFINIKNKYSEIIKDEDNNILSTKKYRKEKYGIGIKIIEKIVKKYDGYLKIKDDDNEFNVSIILNV